MEATRLKLSLKRDKQLLALKGTVKVSQREAVTAVESRAGLYGQPASLAESAGLCRWMYSEKLDLLAIWQILASRVE